MHPHYQSADYSVQESLQRVLADSYSLLKKSTQRTFSLSDGTKLVLHRNSQMVVISEFNGRPKHFFGISLQTTPISFYEALSYWNGKEIASRELSAVEATEECLAILDRAKNFVQQVEDFRAKSAEGFS